MSANRLAPEVGVSQATLSRWVHEARSVDGRPTRTTKKWTSAEQWRVVVAAHGLSETDLLMLRAFGMTGAMVAVLAENYAT